jgi:hypothetical protein
VMHHMPLDGVADQLAAQFLMQRLPPPPRKVSMQGTRGLPASRKGCWARWQPPVAEGRPCWCLAL